jgi:hypothetical protein
MPKNREKSFSRSLHAPISDIWRQQLRPLPTPTEPNRHSAYIVIAGSDIDRTDLFKPAPYLLSDTQISPKCLFRVRTQHAKEIPTHNHLHSTSYSDRSCPFCHSTLIVGNESHYLFGCPSITPIMEPMYVPFKKLLKQSALPSWEQLHQTTKISLLLGSSLPPQIRKLKSIRDQWRLSTGNYCALVALKLSSSLSSPPTTVRVT